jgi:hypothetical protein
VTAATLLQAKEKMIVMHPLPRLNEIRHVGLRPRVVGCAPLTPSVGGSRWFAQHGCGHGPTGRVLSADGVRCLCSHGPAAGHLWAGG